MQAAYSQHTRPREFEPGDVEPKPQRLRHDGLEDVDRRWAVFIHLSPLLTLFVQIPAIILPPLVLWLIRKDKSVFADDHGREALNFTISFTLLSILLAVTLIGLIALPILWIVGLVNLIRGAVAAGNGEYFRYPMTFRFLS